MSGSKLVQPDAFRPVTVQSHATQLDLPEGAVQLRKNGIEFRSPTPFPVWAEMTVALQTNLESKRLNCHGVVVACDGTRHQGYLVSMVFTDVSRHTQARLNALAYSS